MSVTKLAIRAVMVVGMITIGTTARGDSILTLGLFSSSSNSATGSNGSGSNGNLAPTNQAASTPTSYYSAPTPSAPSPQPVYDAMVNFGNGPFPDSGSLTTGNAQAWYNSSKILGLFGGQPNAQQISSFDSTVLQRVQQTFQLGGVPVALTDDTTAVASHSLSVVSNTVNPSMGNAIGMTYVGGNGFHFIDNAAPYANSVDQLEWIVAHNVAHELMLAFGVPEVHDQTGQYIDSTIGQMSMFLNQHATFSQGAIQDLLSRNFKQRFGSPVSPGAQLVDASAVPEPATLATWGLVALSLVVAHRTRSRRALNLA